MSHGSRFVKLLTLVALLTGLVGCGAAVDAPSSVQATRLVLPNRAIAATASPTMSPHRDGVLPNRAIASYGLLNDEFTADDCACLVARFRRRFGGRNKLQDHFPRYSSSCHFPSAGLDPNSPS